MVDGGGATDLGSPPSAPPWTLGTAVSLAAGASDTYEVTIIFTLDDVAQYVECDTTPNHGLFNRATLTFNQETTDSDACTEVETGTIVIVKHADPNSETFVALVPGTYHVSEGDPAGLGYLLTDVTCDDPTLNSARDEQDTLQVNINLAGGETVTCTFVNTAPGGGGRGPRIPVTGFAPGVVTELQGQPAASNPLGVRLLIPKLGLDMDVEGVPMVHGVWQTDWLTGIGGWLEGTAFPGLSGNSIIMSHVVTHYGSPGPFAHLNSVSAGDYIFVQSFGRQYVYEVKSLAIVSPNNTSVYSHADKPTLTLITCSNYNAGTKRYDGRFVVHAELIAVQPIQ